MPQWILLGLLLVLSAVHTVSNAAETIGVGECLCEGFVSTTSSADNDDDDVVVEVGSRRLCLCEGDDEDADDRRNRAKEQAARAARRTRTTHKGERDDKRPASRERGQTSD